MATLTPVEYYKGSKGFHPTVLCKCDCGNTRIVRQTRLKLGKVSMCAACARSDAAKRGGDTRRKFTEDEVRIRNKVSEYKQGAKRRKLAFKLSYHDFAHIVSNPCRYCGENVSGGVDRLDNKLGYTIENSVPCCDKCNYAKREMSEAEFLDLVEKIHEHKTR